LNAKLRSSELIPLIDNQSATSLTLSKALLAIKEAVRPLEFLSMNQNEDTSQLL